MVLSFSSRARSRQVIGTVALAATLATSACLPTLPTAAPSTSAPTNQASRSNTIRIGKSIRGDLNGLLAFAAPVQAKGEISVVPRVIARVDQLNVDIGSRVRPGDVLAELDRSGLEQQVLAAQAAQASAEARLAALKAGPKPELLAQAQANQRAAQARVTALESARSNSDITTLDARVRDARASLDQAQAALTPDATVVAAADAAAAAARTKLTQLQADPTKANDKPTMDAARADVSRLEAAATAARTPAGSQVAVESARRDLQDAQQAQLMVRLSTTAFDLDQARALLEVANAQVNLANAPSSTAELNAAETIVEEAFAQAELARSRLRDATITAPISGIVTEIKARVGASVGPSAPLLTLIPPDMQVVVQADESQLSQIQAGQAVNLSVESFPKEAFTGTVKAVAPVLDPRTRSLAVQIDVPDPQGKLKPGMFAQLSIQVGQRAGALMVPKDAVLRVGSVDPTAPVQSVVYTVTESRVHKQIVNVGASDGKNIEIVQGLSEGIDLVLNPRPDFLEGELISAP
ncbi:MAG TPA: efflux RND transporter periplasmic adaptor subunit [Chloroflexota bacterium]|jgi:RND family efflux transporter MFP subunit|nr:efflux RND transporter periplasmic adaptor subunit [Chloroflexota bacterium]